MQHINAYQNAEQLVARLAKQTTINAASHILRLKLLSENGTRTLESFSGVERDFLVSILYTMNEVVALLNALGYGSVLEALRLSENEIMDWYDATLNAIHNVNTENTPLAAINEAYAARWEQVSPSPQPPANAKQMDKAFKDDDEGEDIAS